MVIILLVQVIYSWKFNAHFVLQIKYDSRVIIVSWNNLFSFIEGLLQGNSTSRGPTSGVERFRDTRATGQNPHFY